MNLQYDLVDWIDFGSALNFPEVSINNIVSLADRGVSPDGDMIYPFQTINAFTPPGVHHNHKYWEIELVLDSDWLPDKDNPLDYWAYTIDVGSGGGTQTPIVCNAANPYIEHMVARVREADGTQTRITYTWAHTNQLWCIGEKAEFSNEVGERHQTTTFRFLFFGTRSAVETADVYAPGADELAVKYMNIDNFTVGANDCTNILRFSDEFVMLMTPQFIPNTFIGQDLKQDQHWRLLTVVVDSETNLFNPYISTIAANTVFPAGNFFVEFTLADGSGTTERWAYDPTESYIINRREGRIHADVPRDTIEYQIYCPCTKTITHP